MVLATVSHSNQSSGTKQPYGVWSHQLPLMRLSSRSPTPQKPLRTGQAVTQNVRLDPRRVTVRCWRAAEESRPPSVGTSSSPPRRLSSLSTRSPGRLGRSRRLGVTTPVSSRLMLSLPPVTGPGANPSVMGSGVCRSATAEVEPQRIVVRARSPWCPSSACSSPGRAGGPTSRSVHVFSSRQGFGSWSVQPFRKRFRSKACCFRHR